MFRDVAGCSGMFRVPSFIDGRLAGIVENGKTTNKIRS